MGRTLSAALLNRLPTDHYLRRMYATHDLLHKQCCLVECRQRLDRVSHPFTPYPCNRALQWCKKHSVALSRIRLTAPLADIPTDNHTTTTDPMDLATEVGGSLELEPKSTTVLIDDPVDDPVDSTESNSLVLSASSSMLVTDFRNCESALPRVDVEEPPAIQAPSVSISTDDRRKVESVELSSIDPPAEETIGAPSSGSQQLQEPMQTAIRSYIGLNGPSASVQDTEAVSITSHGAVRVVSPVPEIGSQSLTAADSNNSTPNEEKKKARKRPRTELDNYEIGLPTPASDRDSPIWRAKRKLRWYRHLAVRPSVDPALQALTVSKATVSKWWDVCKRLPRNGQAWNALKVEREKDVPRVENKKKGRDYGDQSWQRDVASIRDQELVKNTEVEVRALLRHLGVPEKHLHLCVLKVLRSPPGALRQKVHTDTDVEAPVHDAHRKPIPGTKKAEQCISVIIHLNPGKSKGTYLPVFTATARKFGMARDATSYCEENAYESLSMEQGDMALFFQDVPHYGPDNPEPDGWRWVLFMMFSPEDAAGQDEYQSFHCVQN
jgi:hypothetical protein